MADTSGTSPGGGKAEESGLSHAGKDSRAGEAGFAETRGALRQFGSALRHDFAAASRRFGAHLRRNRSAPVSTRGKPPRRRKSVLVRAFRGFALLALLGVLGAAAVLGWALRDIPWNEIADGSLKPVVVLETADGTQMVSQGPFQGAYAMREDFPQHLVDAVLTAEDQRFYDHFGLDIRGISRALLRNIRAGTIVQGGSTITQQLVKIAYLEHDRTLKRKIQEAVIALWLERSLGKDEILTRYLNNIYLGAGATGVPAAARVYFDKEVGELTPGESAMLAGLIRAPSQLNPLENPEGARERTDTVLNMMVSAGKLEAAEAEEAKRHFAELRPTRPVARSGSWFADWVSDEAREIAGPYRGTIEVQTTLNPRLQALAEKAVTEVLEREGAAAGASEAALVAMTPDGAVVAMVGGRDYEDSTFNRAVMARRQPGSAFKLFTYYAALKAGFSLADVVEDGPIKIGNWEPENFSGDYFGSVTLAEAFARSLNAATVALAMEVGIDNVVAAARELGIDGELGETPSVVLGSYEVSLLDLTGAYASVRAGKAPIEPWGLASFHADGQPRAFSVSPPKQAETDLRAYQGELIELLQLVVERGTGQAARLGTFAAGKTGTSQNFRDAWFIGFTEPLVAGVWVGNDDDAPMNEVTGGKLPAEIWRAFMEAALQELGQGGGQIIPPRPLDQPLPQGGEPNLVGSILPPPPGALQSPAALMPREVAAPASCNVDACARRYRSFRAADCSYQPFSGPRAVCTIPPAQGAGQRVEVQGPAPAQASFGQRQMLACDYRACSRQYRSFRPSDCTYQPFGGGPRRLCQR